MTPRLPTRQPQLLAQYRCGRSLACCQLPWKATLQPAELPLLLAEPGPAAQLLRGALSDRPGTALLRQPGGSCALLDREAQACRLQQRGGLAALPLACRNFPRSVVQTPEHREVAFSLACPTAAALVVAAPQPFAWAHAPPSERDQAYPPHRVVADRVAAARAADWTLAELEQWRLGWWQRLGDPAEELLQVLVDAQTTPLDPWARSGAGPSALDLRPWSPPQVHAVTEALMRLRDSGSHHRALSRSHWQRWLAPVDRPLVAQAAGAHRALAGCCAALWLQHAGLHDGLTLGEAMGLVVRQTGQLLRLLAEFQQGPPSEFALRDAVIAASHWAR